MEDFYAALDTAKRIEKNALARSEFSEKIEIVKTIDLEPREFEDMTYADLVNMYERAQKVISATKSFQSMPTVTAGSTVRSAEVKKIDVESKVKQITNESLEKAEELSREFEKKAEIPAPSIAPQPAPKKPIDDLMDLDLTFEKDTATAPQKESEIMFEREAPELPMEKEVLPAVEIEERKEEKRPRIMEEAAPIDEMPAPSHVKPMPGILAATEAKHAEGKYSEIEGLLRQELGGEGDDEKIKKRMLSLTKDLFREKSTTQREQIKLQIVVLKNMLGKSKKPPKARARQEQDYSADVYTTLMSTQRMELSSAKDTIQTEFSEKISAAKHRYFDAIREGQGDDSALRAAYDALVGELNALEERVGAVTARTGGLLAQKHSAELKGLGGSGSLPTKTAREIEKAIAQMNGQYMADLDNLKEMLFKRVESLKESAAQEVQGTKAQKNTASQLNSVIFEINETDEGTLLYYLHSKNPAYYKKYERHHVSRAEAIAYAKILMAKERGLNDASIQKYFGTINEEA